MTTAMTASSTRHATGRANSGRSSRAPYPSAVNHTTLPSPAPPANHHRCAAVRARDGAEQHHRVEVHVRVQPRQRQAGGDGGAQSGPGATGVGAQRAVGRGPQRAPRGERPVGQQEQAPRRRGRRRAPAAHACSTAPAPATPATMSTRSEAAQTATTASTCSPRRPCRSTKAFCAPIATMSDRPSPRPEAAARRCASITPATLGAAGCCSPADLLQVVKHHFTRLPSRVDWTSWTSTSPSCAPWPPSSTPGTLRGRRAAAARDPLRRQPAAAGAGGRGGAGAAGALAAGRPSPPSGRAAAAPGAPGRAAARRRRSGAGAEAHEGPTPEWCAPGAPARRQRRLPRHLGAARARTARRGGAPRPAPRGPGPHQRACCATAPSSPP